MSEPQDHTEIRPVRMGKESLLAALRLLERGERMSADLLEFFVATVRYMEGQIDYQANYIQAYRDENEQQRRKIASLLGRLERLTGYAAIQRRVLRRYQGGQEIPEEDSDRLEQAESVVIADAIGLETPDDR